MVGKRSSDKDYRSAESGEYVTEEEARRHPDTTYSTKKSAKSDPEKVEEMWADYQRRKASRMFEEGP